MDYTVWREKIRDCFLEAGFNQKVAREKANNYRGMWREQKDYVEPRKVVELAMKRASNQYDLSVASNTLWKSRDYVKRKKRIAAGET